jgi:uncharacterized membrane protein
LGGQKCTTCNSQANGLNLLGETAVGSETSKTNPNGEDFCAYGTHHQCLAALGGFGALRALPVLSGGNNANAIDVNDLGQVVGLAENGTSDATCVSGGTAFQLLRFEAVSWGLDGRIQELHPLSGDTVGFSVGINDRRPGGRRVGFVLQHRVSDPVRAVRPHAVLWDSNGSPTDLGHLPGTPAGIYNIATSLNYRGDVVGFACVGPDTNPATCPEDTFLWTKETGMQGLGRFPGALATGPPCCHTINNNGVIVGLSVDASFNERAIIWLNQVPVDLNTLIPQSSGWYLVRAQGIQRCGRDRGLWHDKRQHARIPGETQVLESRGNRIG